MARYYRAWGTLRYSDSGWVVLDCPHSIVRYYNWWVRTLTGTKASPPKFGSHITVVAGRYESPKDVEILKRFIGKRVRFVYDSVLLTDGCYFWLLVHCPLLHKIRRQLGLKEYLKWPLHLTVANLQ